ncbi:MAG TPA: branched-chain amino acid ABC transporter permease [Chloroflexota bacterium]|jgi:branched-chain amino acid transport system permease protein|nr:branched-chain amino acid ABC transporter permease [Chloroflexota bacterium]
MTFADLWATYGSLVSFVGINAILALSIYVPLSAGLLSVGTAGFMSIGAFTATLLTMQARAPYAVAVAAGGVTAAIAGLVLGVPVLRLRGVYLAIATIGFGEIVRIVFLNVPFTGGALGINGIPRITEWWHIAIVLLALVYLFARMPGSKMGVALAAIREDEVAARASGVEVTRYKTVAFVLGAAIAGVAGGLSAHLTFFISPNDFSFALAVNTLVYAVVGGTAAFVGPILGAAIITLLPELLRVTGITAGAIRFGVNGLILLLVILFLPNGLLTVFTGRRRLAPA